MTGSACIPHWFQRADCATENYVVGLHYAGVLPRMLRRQIERLGCTMQGFQRAYHAMQIRWLACIIHGFCGVVDHSDDLEMIWR